jgi:tetratricopeptide (TPR) repeat protein
LAFLAACIVSFGQEIPAPLEYEAISLLGKKLAAPAAESAAIDLYRKAKVEFERNPNEANVIWLGRRAAYLGLYREAVRIFGYGLERFPNSFRLLRHRGHRYVTLRLFDRAIADLKRAASLSAAAPLDVEPDGIPNRARKPLSNTQFNIWYHLGLAHYLEGDFASAAEAYRECLKWSKNDDLVTAATDWLYMSLRRLGRDEEAAGCLAPVRERMKIIENGAYHQRLLVYKGIRKPESLLVSPAGLSERDRALNFAVQAYGLGNWHLYNGETAKARALFDRLVEEGSWAAFGTIAAVAALYRMARLAGPAGGPNPETADIRGLLRAWNAMWNASDLTPVGSLFLGGEGPSYFSSEKRGLIRGLPALLEHHRGFGFVPGGTRTESRLWLEDVRTLEAGGPDAFLVTAVWGFDRGQGPAAAQRGPVTFVIVRTGAGFRIAHAHFSNDPAK